MSHDQYRDRTLVLWGFAMLIACQERPAPQPAAPPDPQLQAAYNRAKSELDDERKRNELLKVYVSEATKTINDVQDKLTSIGPIQGTITQKTQDPELRTSFSESQRQALLGQITNMQLELKQSAHAITEFKKKESAFSEKVAGLSATIDRLQTMVTQKTREIAELRQTVATLSIEVERLQTEQREDRALIAARQQTIEEKQRDVARLNDQLNTAHVAIGTVRDLIAQRIVIQVGRIRRSRRVSPDLDPAKLTPIDTRTTSEFIIPAAMDRIEVISVHPASSFRIEARAGVGTALVVEHPETFWQFRYLIIGTK